MFLPLEQDICDMRIFTYGYNAEFMKAGGRSYTSILDFAKNLLYDMKFFIDDAAADLSIGKVSPRLSRTHWVIIADENGT